MKIYKALIIGCFASLLLQSCSLSKNVSNNYFLVGISDNPKKIRAIDYPIDYYVLEQDSLGSISLLNNNYSSYYFLPFLTVSEIYSCCLDDRNINKTKLISNDSLIGFEDILENNYTTLFSGTKKISVQNIQKIRGCKCETKKLMSPTSQGNLYAAEELQVKKINRKQKKEFKKHIDLITKIIQQ